MPKLSFSDDVQLLDRFQSFSAEVLRLASLSIAAIGYMLNSASAATILAPGRPIVRIAFIVGLVALGLSICASLVHRYASTDSMAWHLDLERKKKNKTDVTSYEERRDLLFAISTWSIFAAPTFLIIGAVAVATGFVAGLT